MHIQIRNYIILLLIVVGFAHAQPPDTLWTKIYGGSSNEDGTSLIETSDGNYMILGVTQSFGSGSGDVWLIKSDFYGDTLWTRTFGGQDFDWARSIRELSDGNYIIVGGTSSYGQGEGDAWLIKTDANGDTLWTKTFGGEAADWIVSVDETNEGDLIIAGGTYSFGGDLAEMWLIKTDANGDTLWTRTYGGDDHAFGESVLESSDGNYLITGSKLINESNSSELWVVKTDPNGTTLWERTYGGSLSTSGRSMIEASDGSLIIIGDIIPYENNAHIRLLKIDTSGDTQWTRTYAVENEDRTTSESLIESVDGGYVLLGNYGSFNQNILLIKTDGAGNEFWRKSFGGDEHSYGKAVIETREGSYLVEGYRQEDIWLVKTQPEGPEIIEVDVSDKQIMFFWNAEHFDRYLYRVYRKSNTDDFIKIDSVMGLPLETFYVDNNLQNGTRYRYKITSVTNDIESAFSNEVSGTPNAKPVLAGIVDQQTREEFPITINLQTSDPDNDAITYSAYSSEDAIQISVNDSSLILSPVEGYWGSTSISVIASDYSLSDTTTFILTTLENQSPSLDMVGTVEILEDVQNYIVISASDPENDNLTYSATSSIEYLSVAVVEDTLRFSSNPDWYGSADVRCSVADYSRQDTISFELHVIPINDQPIAIDKNHSVQEGVEKEIILGGITGPENESDQSLSYIISSLPADGFLSNVAGGTALTAQDLPFTLSIDTVHFWQDERFETTTFEFQVLDDGSTENGGVNLSETATVSLALNIPHHFSLTTNGAIDGGVTLIDDDILYVASSGDGVHRYDENGNSVYTLNVNGDIKSSTTITPDHTVYIASTDNNLYSFNANGISNTGWPVSLGAEATASVAVDVNGTAYIGTSNGIFQAVTPDGVVSWGYNVGGAVYASAAISQDNAIYIVNENGRIFAFDLNTLSPSNIQYSWVYDLNEAVQTSPALDDLGNLYITTQTGNLIKIEDTGSAAQEVWRYSIGAEINSSPVIGSDYTIYFGADDSTTYAINSNGSLMWSSTGISGKTISTPALAESGTTYDRLYIGSDDGYLYALSLIDGSVTWKYNAQSPIQCPILFSEAIVYFGTLSGDVVAIQDEEVLTVLAKLAEVSTIWPTFQGNNARTGVFGGGTSIPAISNVHPGDADNDGDVDAQDILPLGIYFLEQGDTRSSATMGWSSQDVTSWDSYPANYADCNGDGTVDEKDVIAIGVNWGQTHADGLLKYRIDPANKKYLSQYKESFERLYTSIESNEGVPGRAMKRVLEEVLGVIPSSYVLYQNYPNPFNPDTEIQFSLPKSTQVTLMVYNLRGEIVSELIGGSVLNAGYHSATFRGSEHSSGIYFYELNTPNFHAVNKMLLVK